jgi:hypothetical protein
MFLCIGSTVLESGATVECLHHLGAREGMIVVRTIANRAIHCRKPPQHRLSASQPFRRKQIAYCDLQQHPQAVPRTVGRTWPDPDRPDEPSIPPARPSGPGKPHSTTCVGPTGKKFNVRAMRPTVGPSGQTRPVRAGNQRPHQPPAGLTGCGPSRARPPSVETTLPVCSHFSSLGNTTSIRSGSRPRGGA